jgi:leader peptidase (prepilin peptidase) / N-methyltransferase
MTLSPPLLSRWCAVVARTAGAMRTGYTIPLAAIAASLGVAASIVMVPDTGGLWGAGLAVLMVAIAAVDMRLFIIPDELTAAALALGLAYAAVLDDTWLQALGWSLLRGAATALVLLALRAGYRWWRGREGIGLGDVKLAAVAGVWLDWPGIPVAIDIAAVAALATYLILYLIPYLGFRLGFRRTIRPTTRLPFGLFLAPAIWLAWIAETTPLLYPTIFSS